MNTVYRITDMPMAFSDCSAEQAAAETGAYHGVLVEITSDTGPNGWPTVAVTGTAAALRRVMTDTARGWGTGDDEWDEEVYAEAMRGATRVYGRIG